MTSNHTSMIQAEPTDTSLILGVEVWSPVDGEMIRQSAAPSIGDLDQMVGQSHSRIITGRVDEACLSKMPVLVDLKGSDLIAMLWPVIDREKVNAVVAVYFQVADQATLAVEVWTGKPGRSELCLGDVCYAGLDRFAKLSPYIAFPKSSGLPGLAWETNRPVLVEGLAKSPTFMRSTGAESEGLDIGFALPCIAGNALQAVTLLLSSAKTPIARAYEVWFPAQQGSSFRLARVNGAYVDAPALEKASAGIDVPAGDTWIGRAWATRKPEVVCDSSGEAFQRKGIAEGGLTCGIAIPIIVLDDVAAVAVIMW